MTSAPAMSRAEIVAHCRKIGRPVPRELAEPVRTSRAEYVVDGVRWPILPPPVARHSNWLEKDEQRCCLKLLRGVGFVITSLSQAQKSMQSAGVPDAMARKPGYPVLWLECKRYREPELWTPAQQQFMRDCTANERYVLGTEQNVVVVLREWGIELPAYT